LSSARAQDTDLGGTKRHFEEAGIPVVDATDETMPRKPDLSPEDATVC
jgi:hypothetical protein